VVAWLAMPPEDGGNTVGPGCPGAAQRHAPRLVLPRAHDELLLRAALDAPGRAAASWHRWLAEHPDPRSQRAVWRLLPLIWWNLGGPEATDVSVRDLAAAYRENWSRLQEQTRATEQVVATLAESRIRAVLLKGMALAQRIYERPALRPMADVDLLVRPADRASAAAVLERLGYRAGRRPGARALATLHSLGYFALDGTAVDLHSHALQECCYPGDDDGLWARTEPWTLGGAEALTPDPASLLLMVCAHGLRWNREPPVRWIADAVTLLRREAGAIDWEWLCGEAQRRRLSRLMAAALAWLEVEFAAPIPAGVLAELRASGAGRLERAELWARQRPPSLLTALIVRWGVHARRAGAGVDEPGVRGFLAYLRDAWDVDTRDSLARALVGRAAARRGRRGGEGSPA
jgi:Uncharacterised nucleotidyltransferase